VVIVFLQRPAVLAGHAACLYLGSTGLITSREREMPSLRDSVNDALKAAMKSRDAARTSALRMMLAAVKERDVDARGAGKPAASEDELLAAFARMIRQREESAKAYDEGARPELAAKERAEIEVIRGFLPKQMDEAEVEAAVVAAIGEAGAASVRDMGKVMAILKARHAVQMDFGKASALVKAKLG
jgi:uncharacterized protein YqeY